jgi:uncharacterized membrane protein
MQENPPQHKQQVIAVQEQFSGPIPHPNILAKYDQIVPGAAERIIKMAENQALHRMSLEKTVIGSDVKKSERGQIFGLIVALFGLVVGLILGLFDRQIAASVVVGADLASLASVFIYGRWQKKRERKEASKTP